ncbi:CidA/LrgA family holin-like protein [Priestia koreensis]|uniref:CidA/LrgA family holin-like protein n=1 Tax=Priestia koreensis TaxID=284581 RepID=UPI001F58AFD5|nr:CidA/LrgA family holin-like protein [Priestia koreensis]UNL87405.1 CidA/LrgA family holin-like protein [Priestia koreensis]
MKIIRIIIQIMILYVFSFVGEYVHQISHLPIPGSIIGLLLLFILLLCKVIPVKIIEDGSSFLLAFLPLLFIPAITGIMKYPSLFSLNGAILFFIIIASTILTMIVAGFVSQFLEQKANRRKEEKACNKQSSQSL